MYGDLFEITFNKHKKLMLELLDPEPKKTDVNVDLANDPNWEDKVNWDEIAKGVDFNKTISLEDFLGLDESKKQNTSIYGRFSKDKRRAGKYINHITYRYKKDYDLLPEKIKQTSKEYYKLFLLDPTIGKLRFHTLTGLKGYAAINAGNHDGKTYRSLGKIFPDIQNPNIEHIKWFFIGGHAQYEDLLAKLKKNFTPK